MEKNHCFVYTWYIDEEQENGTSIRIYCLNDDNTTSCLKVDNFTPFVYIELPININWNEGKAQLIGNKLDELMGNKKPLRKILMNKKKLYGAHLKKDSDEYKQFPYLLCSFATRKDIKILLFKLRKRLHIIGLGSIQLKIHESDADEILQLTCCRKIPTAGWIEFHGKIEEECNKITLCDKEYKVKWKNIFPYETDKIALPKIMGFDIEVNSTNPTAMPKPENPGDVVFQISCVIFRHGDLSSDYEKYLLTLGQPDTNIVGEDVLVMMFETEASLLEGFTEFLREENPNLIVGYNILQFDIPYMLERAKYHMCMFDFDKQGFHKYNHAKEKIIKWSSSAYKNQEFRYLDAEGRVFVDLLPLVQRDFKFNNYKLKTISEYFIGETKDPLSVKGIFKCYRVGIKKNSEGEYSNRSQKAMALCGKYCVQDSALVCLLMDKLQTWVGLTEMAKTCNVPIFTLYTQGQQIKVYSQLYQYCMYKNIVVEKDAYEVGEGERFVGAHVFPPIPGQYKSVVPFDFASLYPTTIIAYNIDYHTWVPDDSDIPDNKCHIMQWEDHISCEHDPKIIRMNNLTNYIKIEEENIKKIRTKRDKTTDKLRKKELKEDVAKLVNDLKPYKKERSEINKTKAKIPMCDKRYYRFIKEPKGILPTIIQNLLDARKHTRKVDMTSKKDHIKNLLKHQEKTGTDMSLEIKDYENILGVLDKRQLAYKVSANSMYGAMGVRRGYLPFMPGAMCLAGDSLVSLSAGYTRRIDKVFNTHNIWSYNNGQVYSKGSGVVEKGVKKVMQITLQDGRILKCTPDHKILTTAGWVETNELSNKFKIIVGLELPEDIIGKDEKNWSLLDYDIQSDKNRDLSLAFARVLGFILADGYIGKNKTGKYESSVSLGTLLDSNSFVEDIYTLTGKRPAITSSIREDIKGSIYKVSIPITLVSKIVTLEGISIGKRTIQCPSLPHFLQEPNCPKSIIREFLAGLFGGDGTSPSLSVSHPSFSSIQLTWQIIKKYSDEMLGIMDQLVQLLSRFDLDFRCMNPTLARTDRMTPKDYHENPRVCHGITCNSNFSLKFAKTIGFRYCINKNNRLSVAASYQRFYDNVKQQRINVITETNEIFDSNNITMQKALEKALEKVYANELPLHNWGSFPNVKTIYNYRANMSKLQGLKLLKKYFPTASEYTTQINCNTWFENKYSVLRTDLSAPCLELGVINIKSSEECVVYDIIDMDHDSFFANGICVHNCTTYMGRKNIELVADTITKKHGGELIYGDSVTEDTPVLCKMGNTIFYRTIDDLPQDDWIKYRENKEEAVPHSELEIWTDNGWTKIKRVIRHKTTKEIFRVLTHTGVVDVTEDHGLLDLEGNEISPKDITIGFNLMTQDLPSFNSVDNTVSSDLAFVKGLFYADGSCGIYRYNDQDKASWAINNKDIDLLNKCKYILNNEYSNFTFKILDTLKSSGVYKLVCTGCKVKDFVKKWRTYFYDKRKYKIVPQFILESHVNIRQSFLDGYYAGDGDKDKNGYYRFDNKGKIGSACLYYLATSLGYNVSINIRNDKPDIYRMTCTKNKQRKSQSSVKKIVSLGTTEQYVYDLETENHHFSAGIGKLIVHNTDSNYIHFPHMKDKSSAELWDYSEEVADKVTKLFPPPISLEFEEAIYDFFFILTKKRYMYRAINSRLGEVDKQIGKKGVLLARRDNSKFVRDIYEGVITMIADNVERDNVIYWIIQEIQSMFTGNKPYTDFIITKSVGNCNNCQEEIFYNDKNEKKAKVGDYTTPLLSSNKEERQEQMEKKGATTVKEFYLLCLPAQVQLAEKMKRRGQRVDSGSRLEYLVTDPLNHTEKQYNKIECSDYYKKHSSILKIDYFYYLKALSNPLDQVLNVAYNNEKNWKPDFILHVYNHKYKNEYKHMIALNDLFKIKIELL